MNAQLIADLEIVKGKLRSLEAVAVGDSVEYEIVCAKTHVERAIEWEKSRP